jgi:hypothetical protein
MILTLYMAVVGALEAVIYLWRYRSASRKSHWSSALSSGAVQLVRVLGIGGVAAALDSNEVSGVWYLTATAAYVVSPVVVTAWMHKALEERDGD